MNKNSKNHNLKEDEIDVIEFLIKIWKNKKLIIKTTLLFFLVGIIYSLSLTNIYESSSTFYPHYEKPQNNSIQSLAGLAGLNLENNSYSNIPTSLYPNLFKSIPYKEEILNEEIEINSNKVKYKDYLFKQNLSKSSILKEYTIGLPSKFILFIRSITSKNSIKLETKNNNYLKYNDKDYDLFNSLEKIINLKTNKKDGYIILSVKDELPEVAAQIAQIAQDKLQDRIINYKLKNTMLVYDYTSEQYNKRRNEFYHLQDSLANFKDRNMSIKSDLFLNQLERLQYEVSLTNSIYKELALSKEKVELEIKKNTPIFTIINPVVVPNQKIEPKRSSIVISTTFFGLIFSIIFVLFRDPVLRIKKEITK